MKYIDPSGYVALKNWNEFWNVVNNLLETGGSWNSETGYSDGSQGGGGSDNGHISINVSVPIGGGYVTVTVPYLNSLTEVTVTAKVPHKNTPTTPISNNQFFSQNPQGQVDIPDGLVYSFSFDFAFGGGAGFEIGLVTDKNGGKQWFVSGNANIGYGISVGPSIRSIQSIPGSTFKASDYLGYSAGFSVGLFDVGGFYGGNKPQWNITDFVDFGDSYIENGLGISKIKAPVFGAWWSNTSTKKLFGR